VNITCILFHVFIYKRKECLEKALCFPAYSVGYLGADQVRIFAKSVPYGV
jgi:hypothetical protein